MIDVGSSFFNPVLIIDYWNLRFVCNLVLGICTFRHKNLRQSHLSLIGPKGQGFRYQINGYCKIKPQLSENAQLKHSAFSYLQSA